MKKTFNYEKNFQQEKIAIGRKTDAFYHYSAANRQKRTWGGIPHSLSRDGDCGVKKTTNWHKVLKIY